MLYTCVKMNYVEIDKLSNQRFALHRFVNLSDAASLWGARAGGNDRGSKHLSHIPNLYLRRGGPGKGATAASAWCAVTG